MSHDLDYQRQIFRKTDLYNTSKILGILVVLTEEYLSYPLAGVVCNIVPIRADHQFFQVIHSIH